MDLAFLCAERDRLKNFFSKAATYVERTDMTLLGNWLGMVEIATCVILAIQGVVFFREFFWIAMTSPKAILCLASPVFIPFTKSSISVFFTMPQVLLLEFALKLQVISTTSS